MEVLLGRGPTPTLRREGSASIVFSLPTLERSTCSATDQGTETSSTSCDDIETEQQTNARRITLCKAVLMEATTNFATTAVVETQLLKSAACRNSGALLPLLSMLAAEQEPSRSVRALETLSFLLLDRMNRRACLELRALDILLDILRRATDQQVLLSALEAVCNLCKHDARDKMALWQHPNKGALLTMLSTRHNSTVIVETLRTCRTLCFAPATGCGGGCGGATGSPGEDGASTNGGGACCGGATASGEDKHAGEQRQGHHAHHHGHHHHHSHHHHGLGQQLLEPALLTVAAELLHPNADVHVLHKALRLLRDASAILACASGVRCPQGCWHNAVFRIVPLLTHCGDVEVVENALTVLVNLSEHSFSHNMLFASGCIQPLLHLLSHKRCAVSQQASCVLSALAEGGMSRDKLCQDTALLALLRVLNANHCITVTLGVLYMLERLASYRASVVRSLKGWGAVQLLQRLMGTTQDADAAEGCRQLLKSLGVVVQPQQLAAAAAAAGLASAAANRLQHSVSSGVDACGLSPACSGPVPMPMPVATALHLAHSSINVFGDSSGNARPPAGVPGTLCRTISAAATVASSAAAVAAALAEIEEEAAAAAAAASGAFAVQHISTPVPMAEAPSAGGPKVAGGGGAPAVPTAATAGRSLGPTVISTTGGGHARISRSNFHSSFRFYGAPGAGIGVAICAPSPGPIAAAAAAPSAAAY
ncbi:hypothetical protein HXX76_004067 [Chlamydomonas incerta]|uniref:Vacuolar protein 8 n=1 Tax=Chlamydomonas incerta TaxID=51695 RepID=A0A835W783_CHLIN|nr:hypothetical protein HXX76_004067 [Chlamydomonas incerta]|eukprot:KAG2439948.1 hypothetical protein HXX76_004067 [Chlamydomonas incerta]